jgi:hypothetical protein
MSSSRRFKKRITERFSFAISSTALSEILPDQKPTKSILNNKIDKLKMLKQAISADLLSGRKRVSI